MDEDLGRLNCRICGQQIFVVVSSDASDPFDADRLFEVSCSRGHTDQYQRSMLLKPDIEGSNHDNIRVMAAIG